MPIQTEWFIYDSREKLFEEIEKIKTESKDYNIEYTTNLNNTVIMHLSHKTSGKEIILKAKSRNVKINEKIKL
jgi:hypothetical protein